MGERESADDNQTRASSKEGMTIVSAVANKIGGSQLGHWAHGSIFHALLSNMEIIRPKT